MDVDLNLDLVVVGSCVTDLISYASHLPREGETLFGHKFVPGFGGKGANQCIAARKLDAKVAMVAKLGNDTFGKAYLENLQDNSVNCDHVSVVDGVSTGVATISVSDNGTNSIIIVPGANNMLATEDVEKAEDIIKTSKVLICQNEIPQETSLAAMRLAKKHQVKIIYNPAPASKEMHLEMFRLPELFCPNETEAEVLTGKSITSVQDAEEAAKILTESSGCKAVIITLGENGAVFLEKSGTAVHIPIKSVKAIDTVGAGDSFIGSLAFFLARMPQLSVPEMIRRACQISSMSVLKPGTQSSYPMAVDVPQELFSCKEEENST